MRQKIDMRFLLVPKSNGKVRPCLDPERLSEALIRPFHRGPTVNDIFPKTNQYKVSVSYRCRFWISQLEVI